MKKGSRVAGRYVIERTLGLGGMGTVYLAHDERLGDRVALKIASACGLVHEEFQERFHREARIGSRLGKIPGFVRALEWGELDDSTAYLAMDLVEGACPLDLSVGTLVERLTRLREAARLVALAHAHGVIHRDLKPQNFLIAADGRLWLSDFGLAKVSGEADAAGEGGEKTGGLTHTGVGMGTPLFMSPEQFEDLKHVDDRADVYALGVMLFVALTNRAPFEGTPTGITRHHDRVRDGRELMPRPSAYDTNVSPALDLLCLRAIALDPADRLESAAVFHEALDGFLSLQNGAAANATAVMRHSIRGGRTGRAMARDPVDARPLLAPRTAPALRRAACWLLLLGSVGAGAAVHPLARPPAVITPLAALLPVSVTPRSVMPAALLPVAITPLSVMPAALLPVAITPLTVMPAALLPVAITPMLPVTSASASPPPARVAPALLPARSVSSRAEIEAASGFRLGAEAGDPTSMVNLGYCLARGRGLVRDDAAAVGWYRKAAGAGSAMAMCNLGVMLQSGRGVLLNEVEAATWFRRSATAGDASAMFDLAVCLEDGHGMAIDRVEAVTWYRRAAAAGSADAQHRLARAPLGLDFAAPSPSGRDDAPPVPAGHGVEVP